MPRIRRFVRRVFRPFRNNRTRSTSSYSSSASSRDHGTTSSTSGHDFQADETHTAQVLREPGRVMSLRLNNVAIGDRLGEHEPYWQDLAKVIPINILDILLRIFRNIDDVETGDLELKFQARECVTVTPRYAGVIPRQVLTSVYEFCKENLKAGEVVLYKDVDSELRALTPGEVRAVINFGRPKIDEPVAVEIVD